MISQKILTGDRIATEWCRVAKIMVGERTIPSPAWFYIRVRAISIAESILSRWSAWWPNAKVALSATWRTTRHQVATKEEKSGNNFIIGITGITGKGGSPRRKKDQERQEEWKKFQRSIFTNYWVGPVLQKKKETEYTYIYTRVKGDLSEFVFQQSLAAVAVSWSTVRKY